MESAVRDAEEGLHPQEQLRELQVQDHLTRRVLLPPTLGESEGPDDDGRYAQQELQGSLGDPKLFHW
jgi:hypothetical protein